MAGSYPVGLIRVSGETLALSSTLASLGAPLNAFQVILYNPSTDFRLHLNPAINEIRFYDASAAAGARYVAGLRNNLTDRDTGTGTGTIMDAATTSDFLYICTPDVVGGFRIVMTSSLNTAVSTIAVEYRKNDDTWAGLTETDGTQTGGNTTLGQTGSVTWTAPTDAKRVVLGGGSGLVTDTDAPSTEGFWWRISFSVALSADVEIAEIWTLNKNTSRGYFRAGVEYPMSVSRTLHAGAIEALLAAGTDTLEITWMIMAGV